MFQSQITNPHRLSADDPEQYFCTDHLKADLRGRFIRGGAVTLKAQALKFLISMLSTLVLARLLTPRDYGLVDMVIFIIGFASIFQYLGLFTATIRWAELNHQQVSALFWVNITFSTAIMLIVIVSAPAVAWFFKEPRLIRITVVYAISILFSGLAIQHEALLSRQMRFSALAVIDLTSLLTGFVTATVAAWYGAGYWALLLNQLTMTFMMFIGCWIACRWRPGAPIWGSGIRSMLSFGGNLTVFNLMAYLTRNLDNALIGKYWGPYQLGLYAKAYQMLLLPINQINLPLAAVAVPALSRLADSPERYRRAYLRIVEKLTMVTIPGVVFMIATSDWLVLLLLGPQWRETGRIFILLGMAAIIQPVTRTSWWLFSTQGRTRDMFHWGMIGGLVAILSIIAGLPWGAVGVAASYAITDLCICTPLLFWFVGRQGPIRASDFYRTLAPSACASLCALVVLLVVRPWLEMFHLVARLAVAFGITIGTSLLVLAILPAGRRAMQDFKEMLFLLIKSGKNESAV